MPDPIEEARERAREHAEGSSQPSDAGLGPGAGNVPADATVSAPPEDQDVPANPSLGEPPRHDQGRPAFRSNQLDAGEESGQGDGPEERASPRP